MKKLLGGFSVLAVLLGVMVVADEVYSFTSGNVAEFQIPEDFWENPRHMVLENESGNSFITVEIWPCNE